MTNKTRKRIWPAAAALSFAVVGVVAALAVVLAVHQPGPASAHGPDGGTADATNICHSALWNLDPDCGGQQHTDHDANAVPGGTTPGNGNGNGTTPGNGATPTPTPTPRATDGGGSGTPINIEVKPPGMVQDLMVVANANGIPQEELLVSWKAPDSATSGPVTSYRIDVSKDGKRWLAYVTDHGNSDLRLVYPDAENTVLDDGEPLDAETTRHFRVFAFYEQSAGKRTFGPGDDESGATDKSHPPAVPKYLTATDDAADGSTQTTITLEWQAPEDPPGAPVTNYDIEVSSDGVNYRGRRQVGDVTTFTHGELLADTQRWYRVRAINRTGKSGWSDGDTGMTLSSVAPGRISKPVIGLAPEASDVYLTWEPPIDPPGDPVTHYRIQARASGSPPAPWQSLSDSRHISERDAYHFTGADLANAGVAVPQSIPDDADELVEVDIRIGAINRKNSGAADADIAWTTFMRVPVGHEDAPLDPSDQGSGAPMVQVDTDRHQGRSGLNVTWATAGFTEGNGPTAAQRYMIDSAQHYTGVVTYVLFIGGEEQRPIPHSNAVRANADQFAAGTAAMMGGDMTVPGYDQDGLATETTREYYYQVVYTPLDALVSNASVRSLPSHVGDGTTEHPTRPGTPENFRVASDGHTEIKLTWSAPSIARTPASECDGERGDGVNDGSECGVDSVITEYKIERSMTGEAPWEVVATVDAPQTYDVDEGRDPGMRYYYRVSTVNSRYTSDPTEAKSAVTHRASNPTPPGGLVAQADGSNAIKLCWYEQNTGDPSDPLAENLPILGYLITYLEADGSEMVLAKNSDPKMTQYRDDPVPPGTTRTYRVRALTLGNIGKMDADLLATEHIEATATTPGIAPEPVLGPPSSVMATVSDGDVTITWTNGANADRHVAVLFDPNWEFDPDHVGTQQTDGKVTFRHVPSGTYTAVVVSIMDDDQGNAMAIDFGTAVVTVN